MSGSVHVVVPGGIDDPERASGGNTYDRRLIAALRADGWRVHLSEVDGGWPWAAEAGSQGLERSLDRVPGGAVVLVDGLLASRLPGVMVPACERLRVILLMHLPVGIDDESSRTGERRVAKAVARVVTPSAWCRDWLVREYAVDRRRVDVATPGVERAPLAPGSASGTSLLCVAALSPVKGQDRLVAALAEARHLPWTCTFVGSDSVAPGFVDELRKQASRRGLDGRVLLAGPAEGDDLTAAYSGADLLVVTSRVETYGMVVAEALSHGVPVVATDVGGVREALGDGGLLVRPDELAPTLRRWLTDASLRAELRAMAHERRAVLKDWSATAARVSAVLREAAA